MIIASSSNTVPYLISFGAVLVSFGSVLATFYGVRYTNRVSVELQEQRLRSEQRNQDRNFLRLKGEELYLLIDTFKSDLARSIGDFSSALVAEGKSGAAKIANIRSSNSASQKIEMLTKVYFPKEVPELEELRTHHGAILAEMLKVVGCNTDEQCRKMAITLVAMSAKTTDLTYKFQKAIIRSLRESGAGVAEGMFCA